MAPDGSDENDGTSINSAFASINFGASHLLSGDTLKILPGYYQGQVSLSGLVGKAGAPIVLQGVNQWGEPLTNQGGATTLAGTVEIEGPWTQVELPNGIMAWQAQAPEDIWQLFISGRMVMDARWPNHANPVTEVDGLHRSGPKGTIWNREGWMHQAEGSSPGVFIADNKNTDLDLAATGLSFEGGMMMGHDVMASGNAVFFAKVLEHNAGENTLTYSTDSEEFTSSTLKAATKGRAFIQNHINALDVADEWHYDPSTKTVYVIPVDGQVPDAGGRKVYGRNQSTLISIARS